MREKEKTAIYHFDRTYTGANDLHHTIAEVTKSAKLLQAAI
jgi:hypothetical protein